MSFALCNNRLSQMPFGLGSWGLRQHHHPSSKGIYPITTRSTTDNLRWIQAQRLAAAEARVAELEQQLQLSQRREPAARRRLIASIRTSFDKMEKENNNGLPYSYTHRIHYSCHATHDYPVRFAYQCKNVDLFLRKAYDLANTDPLDLMHFLVTLEPFPTQSVEIKDNETGYCIKEIDNYVARLHQTVGQYFDALEGQ